MRSTILIIMIFAVAAFVAMFIGCEGPEGPQGPAGTASPLPVYVVGWVGSRPPWLVPALQSDPSTNACVDIYDSPGIPSVEINGIRIPPSNPFYRGCNPFRFYNDTLPVSCGDSLHLRIAYTELNGTPRTAQANIMLPGSFEITCPDTSYDTISVGDSLVFCWTSPEGADVYLVQFDLYYIYVDTSGADRGFGYYLDTTLVADTSIIFSAMQLFPHTGEIDSVEYSHGEFELRAMNGPTPEEDQGNVTGDGIGFFNGWTYGGEVRFFVGGSSPLAGEIVESENPVQKLVEQRAKRWSLY